MGQPLPLPEKIPFPRTTKQEIALAEMGIIIHPIPEGEKDLDHTTYTLPEGWRMVNTNPDGRQDLPEWHILDEENKMRVFVSGRWKVSYDNNLHLQILEGHRVYVPGFSEFISIEQRWAKYIQRYDKWVLLATEGWLLRQVHIDMVYEELVSFCKENPSYTSKLPERHVCDKK